MIVNNNRGPNAIYDRAQVEAWIQAARRGDSVALGRLIESCRAYLMTIASQAMPETLRAKLGPSDLVQDTALEAHRDFASFSGEDLDSLLAWMRRILLNNIANVSRHYENTDKRQVSRELRLEFDGRIAGSIKDASPSVSSIFAIDELRQKVDESLALLPPDMNTVIVLRCRDHLSFREIGVQMQRSTDAARKLWARAIERLHDELKKNEAK